MRAHAHDLRAEVADLGMTDADAADAFIGQLLTGWRHAGLGPAEVALCEYAEALTRVPHGVGPANVEALRAAGFDDRAIHDATQVIGYFNYINRLANGLGVDPESWLTLPDDPS
jgi:uncharacterized peroxidase-related enzyme